MVLIWLKRRCSRIAMARLAPSWGSVPAPSSSTKTRLLLSAASKISTMWVMWLENVDKLCSIDCSSPMSAKISWKMATRLPLSAKIGRPDWAISCASPRVLSMTVLPPVLGPVMTMAVRSSSNLKSLATGLIKSGWRTLSSWSVWLSLIFGITAFLSWR